MNIKTWWKRQDDQTKGRIFLVGAGVVLLAVGAGAAVVLKARGGNAHEASEDRVLSTGTSSLRTSLTISPSRRSSTEKSASRP